MTHGGNAGTPSKSKRNLNVFAELDPYRYNSLGARLKGVTNDELFRVAVIYKHAATGKAVTLPIVLELRGEGFTVLGHQLLVAQGLASETKGNDKGQHATVPSVQARQVFLEIGAFMVSGV
jgi:hypothetical protein